MKKNIKCSVLQVDKGEKDALIKLSERLNMSLTQVIVFGAVTAAKIKHEKRIKPDDKIQIRLPMAVHAELEELSDKLNTPMTDLIKIGIENAFSIRLKGNL